MYETKGKISSGDYIGNSLSSINLNFDILENWTTNIILSSEKLFQPLVNFYKNYGDYWKSSIKFSISINAIDRLTEFSTLVTTNSAKFIKPIIIIYPHVFNIIDGFEYYKKDVTSWFQINYPVTNVNNSKTLFVENSVAYIYMMFYKEELKVNNTSNNKTVISDSRTCSTNNVSTTVICSQSYTGNVDCVKYEPQIKDNICQAYSPVIEPQTKTVGCFMENGGKSITRNGKITIDQYFNDRSENDKLFILKMIVKNCEWSLDRIIPYYE